MLLLHFEQSKRFTSEEKKKVLKIKTNVIQARMLPKLNYGSGEKHEECSDQEKIRSTWMHVYHWKEGPGFASGQEGKCLHVETTD